MKKIKNQRKIRLIKASQSLILIGAIVLLVVLTLNFASAMFNIQNPKQELKNGLTISQSANAYPAITIDNNFGLLLISSTLADMILTEHTSSCDNNCLSEMQITTYQDSPLIDSIKFEGGEPKDYQVYIKIGETSNEVPDYQWQCGSYYINYNGTRVQDCSNVKVGSHTEVTPTLKPYNIGDIMPAGTYDIILKGEKEPSQYIDWKITTQGQEISDWAIWGQINSNVAYWDFNENTGTKLTDIASKTHNGTLIGNPAWTTKGKLSNALIFNGADIAGGGGYVNVTNISQIENQSAFSFSIWFNITNVETTETEAINALFGGNEIAALYITNADMKLNYALHLPGGTYYAVSPSGLVKGKWYHAVGTYNGSVMNLYLNGTNIINTTGLTGGTPTVLSNFLIGRNTGTEFVGSGNARWFNGTIDEFGLWNRTLTQAEVTQIYNGGNGLVYGTELNIIQISTSLNSPPDGAISIINSQWFNTTATVSGGNFTNATLYVWNASSIWTNKTTVTGLSNTTNSSISGLSNGNYIWNEKYCAVNISSTVCLMANVNRTFTILSFIINNVTYNSIAAQASLQTYILNITAQASTFSGIFNYDGTSYIPTKTTDGANILFTDMIIPTSIGNKSFYWSITANSLTTNTSVYNQTIVGIGFDNCTLHKTLAFNFTIYDQDSLGLVGNNTVEGLINVYPYGTAANPIINYSSSSTKGNLLFCINSTALGGNNFTAFYQAKTYNGTAGGYWTEYKYGQNITINNASLPQIIPIYDLQSSEGKEFLINFKDSYLAPYPGVLMDIQRQYISTNNFISTEIPQTDINGNAYAHLIETSQIYIIIAKLNNQIIATFNNVLAKCGTYTCEIDLNSINPTIGNTDWNNFGNLNTAFTLDKSARVEQVIFSTVDGTTQPISWTVSLNDQWGNNTICYQSANAQTGTFTCNIPSTYGNTSIIALVSVNNQTVQKDYNSLDTSTPNSIYAGTSAVLALLMYSTITLMFISNPITIMIGAIMGLIFAGLLFLVDNGGFVGDTAIIMYFIIAGFIFVWQINKRLQQ